jgi:hypothetical protein
MSTSRRRLLRVSRRKSWSQRRSNPAAVAIADRTVVVTKKTTEKMKVELKSSNATAQERKETVKRETKVTKKEVVGESRLTLSPVT